MSEPLDTIEDAKITCERFHELLDQLALPEPASAPSSSSSSLSSSSPLSSSSSSPSSLSTATVSTSNPTPLLVLDLRSFLVYNQAHVKGAINVCIPKTLARRQGFSIRTMEAGICKKNDKDDFRQRKGVTVVLYDQSGAERDRESLLAKCYDALVREMLCQNVYWLEGGFSRLQHLYPDVIRASKATSLLKPCLSSGKGGRATVAPAAPMTAPAEMTGHTEGIIQITDYLFLSGSHIAEDYATLKAYDIRYIINAAAELADCFEGTGDFVYKRLDLEDHPSQHMCFVNVFENCFRVINEARDQGARVLVHCRGGRSRSATIVIAYLMKTYHWSLQRAYKHVQARNPKISPNLGFMGQLMTFESGLGTRTRSGSVSPAASTDFSFVFAESPEPGVVRGHDGRPLTPGSEALASLSSVSLGVES